MVVAKQRSQEDESEFERKLKAAQLAVASVEKEFGSGSIFKGNTNVVDVEVIPTGNFGLDLALGVGGLPRGRITEIFGVEGLGKSLIAQCLAANAQAAGGQVAYIDAEHALDPFWATKLGVKWDEMYISQPDYGEQALNIAHKLIKSGGFDLVIIDSVAALTPKAEIDGEIGDQYMGLQARMMSQALRMMSGDIKKSNTCTVFTNQVREKIGYMSNGGTIPAGGRALRFYASVRIDLKNVGQVKDSDGEVVGVTVKAQIVKNKVAPPFKYVEYDVLHGKGFNNYLTILNMAQKYGYVKLSGSWYATLDPETGEKGDSFAQGANGAVRYMKDNLDFAEDLMDKVTKEYKKRQGYFNTPEEDDDVLEDDEEEMENIADVSTTE